MTKQDIDKVSLATKAILNGIPVRLGKRYYKIGDDYRLCTCNQDKIQTKGNLIEINTDLPFSFFVKACLDLSEDELCFLAGALTTLNLVEYEESPPS